MEVKRTGTGLFEIVPDDEEEAILIGEACVNSIFDYVVLMEGDVGRAVIDEVLIPLGRVASQVMSEGGPIEVNKQTLVNLQRALALHAGVKDPDAESKLAEILADAGVGANVLSRFSGRHRAVALSMNLGGFLVTLSHDSTA